MTMRGKRLALLVSAFVVFFAASAAAYELHNGPTGVMYYEKDKCFNGYTLFTPTEKNNVTYLMDMEGNVVHTWEVKNPGGSNFHARLLPNGNLLLLRGVKREEAAVLIGGSSGILDEIDWNGNVVWSYRMADSDHISHHTFDRMPNGNTLILGWERVSNDKVIAKGRDPKTIPTEPIMIKGLPVTDFWMDFVREVDKDGKTVWEWHVMDHIGKGQDQLDINYILPAKTGVGYDSYDWSHFNTVEFVPGKDGNDKVLMNSRNFSEPLLVDKKTGKIEWRWGNPSSHGQGPAPTWYNDQSQIIFGSHHATMIGENMMSIFDNGSERAEPNRSRVVEVDMTTGKIVWEYAANDGNSFFSYRQGAAQKLPNGNYLVTSTQHGHLFEVTRDKKVVWEFISPIMEGKNSPIMLDDEHVLRTVKGVPVTHMYKNMIHRAYRYAPDYPGLKDKDLSPKGYIVNGGTKWFETNKK